MNLPFQIAKHFREVYFGGNWTSSNLKDNLADVDWQQPDGYWEWFRKDGVIMRSGYFKQRQTNRQMDNI